MQGSPSAEYLGHVITAKGVAVDPSKIECIKHWPGFKRIFGVLQEVCEELLNYC